MIPMPALLLLIRAFLIVKQPELQIPGLNRAGPAGPVGPSAQEWQRPKAAHENAKARPGGGEWPPPQAAKMRNLQDIKAKLRENKDLLNERFNVKEIGIFGSFVWGEQKETSDLDILVEFEGRVILLEIVRLERFLSELLGEKVDLVMKNSLKPRIGKHILREVVYE